MRVLVIGGNGFLGTHVVDALLAAGNQVRIFDRGEEKYRAPLPAVDYRFGDFSDLPTLAEALEGVDVVYHLISTTVPSTSNIDPIGDIIGNQINTVRLLQLLVEKNVRRIIYFSSGGTVYGNPEIVPIPEFHPLRPICSYGVVKVAVENYLFMFQSLYGLKPLVLRVSNPYGARQGHSGVQGIIGTLLQKVLSNEPIVIWGDGSVVRDYLYVSDLANICMSALDSDVCGTFNVGSGCGTSVNNVINCVENVCERKLLVQYKEARGFDIPKVVLDISKACITFGWNPSIGLDEGVRLTWNSMRQNV